MNRTKTQAYYRVAAGAFFFIQGLVFASWASRIPDIKQALGLNEAELGGLLFAIPAGQMSAMALSGYLVTKFGSRSILRIAAILYPCALIIIGAAASKFQLAGALFFFGVAANMCNISVNTQGVGIERLYQRSIMGTFHGLWSLAGFIGGLISTVMVAFDIAPLTHFCIIFGITTAILLSVRGFMLPRDMSPQKKQPEGEDVPKPKFGIRDKLILTLGAITFGSMVCEGTMFDWSSVYFEQVINPPKELVRLGYIAFMFTMAMGRFTADRFVTRFGATTVIRTCGLLITTGLMTAVLFPYLIPATIGFLLVGLGVSSIIPLCYSMAGRSAKVPPGVAIAAVSTIGFFGFLMGPPVIGFIAHAMNLRWSFALIACVGLFIALIVSRLKYVTK